MNCALCGTPAVRDDQRFCARCGSELGPTAATSGAEPTVQSGLPPVPPPPGPPPAPPPAYFPPAQVSGPLFADDAPTVRPTVPTVPPVAPPPPFPVVVPSAPASPRRRGPVVVLVVAAVLAALAGASGVVLLLGDDESPPAAATDERVGEDASTAASEPSATEEETASRSPSLSASPEPRTYRCWSGGAPVTDLEDCGVPAGPDGLIWVFPSAAEPGCFEESSAQRATEADCSPGGVRFHYSEWRSRAALERYYGANTLTEIAAPGGRGDLSAFEVVSRDPDVGYKVAIYYTDPSAVWSVTIYAADRSQYLSAVGGLDVRAFRDLRGTRA